MGCADPLRRTLRRTLRKTLKRGVGAPHQCPLGSVGELPLPLYADVRLHIPMTHRADAGTFRANTETSIRR